MKKVILCMGLILAMTAGRIVSAASDLTEETVDNMQTETTEEPKLDKEAAEEYEPDTEEEDNLSDGQETDNQSGELQAEEEVSEETATQENLTANDLAGASSHTEGKIDVWGSYTVMSDGKLAQELHWTYPYENPMYPGEGFADPGRPYKYMIWQSKKQGGGAWSAWETRSPIDTDDTENKVRVLNVYTHTSNASGLNVLKTWMATDVDGTANNPAGRNIIDVTPVMLSDFNTNYNSILKQAVTATDTNGNSYTVTDQAGNPVYEYKYDVIMFGTCDGSNNGDLTQASSNAVKDFYQAGGGLLFGHDTVTGNLSHPYFNSFATDPEYLGIGLTTGYWDQSNYVKVVDTGFLTSRPWDLEGKTLNIPTTHMWGEYVPTGSNARIWMQFSDLNGNVMTANGGSNYNYYLVSNNHCAMIQTGHTAGQATDDERKVFANTLLYLAQGSPFNSGKDLSFADEAAPTAATGQLQQVDMTDDFSKYSATVKLTGAEDQGTQYAYRIQAVAQAQTSQSGSDYPNEIWSSPQKNTYLPTGTNDENDPSTDTLYQSALSGLRGYYVAAVNTSKTPVAFTGKVDTSSKQFVKASDSGAKVTYTTGQDLQVNTDYYMHVYAVDYAGNVSADLVIPISVNDDQVVYHHCDAAAGSADETVDTSFLTNTGIAASYPSDPARDGYRFLGWYTEKDGEGTKVDADTKFTEGSGTSVGGKTQYDVYADWVKTWTVSVSQRGGGSAAIGLEGGPFLPIRSDSITFDAGSKVAVQYEPGEGYQLKAVWVDNTMYLPEDLSADGLVQEGQVRIDDALDGEDEGAGIQMDHHIVIEYGEDSGEEDYYQIATTLSGGDGKASITPTTSVKSKKDAKVKWDSGSEDYEVVSVTVDGIDRPDLVGKTSITFPEVTADHTVEVRLAKKGDPAPDAAFYTVATEVTGAPATITPTFTVEKGDGSAKTVTAVIDTAAAGMTKYEIKFENVHVYKADGTEVAHKADGTGFEDDNIQYSYDADAGSAAVTFGSVQQDYRVCVQVSAKEEAGNTPIPSDQLIRVTTSHEGEGTISESRIVKKGDSYTVAWTPADGWRLASVLIDDAVTYYPFVQDPDSVITFSAYSASNKALADPGAEEGEEARADVGDLAFLESYALSNITVDHTVHARFVRDTASDAPDGTGTYQVITRLASEAGGTITASNLAVTAGNDYDVEWEVPDGYEVTHVLVNGEDKLEELDGAANYILEKIQKNYTVTVVVEIKRGSGETGLLVKKSIADVPKFTYTQKDHGINEGDKVLTDLASQNEDEATRWAQDLAAANDVYFLGWTDDPSTNGILGINDVLGAGYTTVYPVFSASAPEGGEGDAPDVEVTKGVQNKTHPEGPNRVSDVLHYTIAAKNNKLDDWYNVVMRDKLPSGVSLVRDSVILTSSEPVLNEDGTQQTDEAGDPVFHTESKPLSEGEYDFDETRSIITYTLTPANIKQNCVYALEFDVTIENEAAVETEQDTQQEIDAKKIQNDASATGFDSPGGDGTDDSDDPDDPSGGGSGGSGGDNPDDPSGGGSGGSGGVPIGGISEPTGLPGDGNVYWYDPEVKIAKQAENLTDPGAARTQVYDRILYTLTLATEREYSRIVNGVFYDRIPDGLDLDTSSIRLILADGSEIRVSPDAYDADTRVLAVQAGSIYYGEEVQLLFEATVRADAVSVDGKPAKSIGNTAYGFDGNPGGNSPVDPANPDDPSGDPSGGSGGDDPNPDDPSGDPSGGGSGGDDPNPDNPGGDPGDPWTGGLPDPSPDDPSGDPSSGGSGEDDPEDPTPGAIPSAGPVLPGSEDDPEGPDPADPEPEVVKEVTNTTRENAYFIGDVLEYSISLSNPLPGSVWKNVFIFDWLPEGLELDMRSITLKYPDGTVENVDGTEVYDAAERTLCVPIAQLNGNEEYVLTYKAGILKPAQEKPLTNKVEVTGDGPTPPPTSSVTIPYPKDPNGGAVDTGDKMGMSIWVFLLLVCCSAGTLACLYYRRLKSRYAR